jgi:hypothetical protein
MWTATLLHGRANVPPPPGSHAVGGDGAGEDGDGVSNFGVRGGGFNRSCCCVLTTQILRWRATWSRAKPGELSPAEAEKNEPSRGADGESVAAFPIQSGRTTAVSDVGAGGSVAGGYFGAAGGGGGWALGAGDGGTKIAVAPCRCGASSSDTRRCSRWRGVRAALSRCSWSGSTRTHRAMLGARGRCPSEARAVSEAGSGQEGDARPREAAVTAALLGRWVAAVTPREETTVAPTWAGTTPASPSLR